MTASLVQSGWIL